MNIEERVKLIMKERKVLMDIGCSNPKILYTLTADFFYSKTKEFMQRVDYDTAVKLMYRETQK